MAKALIIVDVQPTFCEGGALPIEGGNDVAKRVAKYATKNAQNYDTIITTQDWHIDPGAHFSDDPDYVDTWPPHGVAGTAEAELHPALGRVPIDYHLKKGQYEASYSGFDGGCPDGTELADILQNEDVDEVDIVGLAFSHCVKETALDAAKKKFLSRVRILKDLTESVSPETEQIALDELAQTRVQIIHS